MRIALAATILCSIGCGTTIRFIPTSNAHVLVRRAQKPPQQVEVFTAGVPARPFLELGMVEGEQSSKFSLDSKEEVFARMREWAGRMGCDGLIVTGGVGTVYPGRYGGHTQGYRGTCIVWRDAIGGVSVPVSSAVATPLPPPAAPPNAAATPPAPPPIVP